MQLQAVNNSDSAFRISICKLWAPRFVISTGQEFVFMGHDTVGFLWTINLYLPLDPYLKSTWTKQRTLKASFFSRKPLKLLETESFAEVQFVIDSCRFVSQSHYLNNSKNDWDSPIVACLFREQYTADATFTRLENKFWFENSAVWVGKLWDSLS